jgi:hypothetical protein
MSEEAPVGGELLGPDTFSEDSPGEVTGDRFADDFGDQHLTWHVVRVGEAAEATPSVSNDGSSTNPADGGLYDYGD